jgi:ABC-2 type transport system permease protein
VTAEPTALELREPWRTGGLLALWRQRRLLWQFTRSRRAKRLQGTALGRLWDYINPLTQFTVYFLVIGVLLGLNRQVPEFPMYIFSGLVVVQFFNGGFTACTNSFTYERLLLRRAVFPREMLPATRVAGEVISFGPPLLVLVVAAATQGWRLAPSTLWMAVAGMALLAIFTYGLGMVFAVGNVFIRDTVQVVGVITTFTRWGTPIIYPWTLVPEKFGDGWITTLYLANPVTIAVFGMREAFWVPLPDVPDDFFPPIPVASLVIAVTLCFGTLALGTYLVHRYQYRIVQRLRWST